MLEGEVKLTESQGDSRLVFRVCPHQRFPHIDLWVLRNLRILRTVQVKRI